MKSRKVVAIVGSGVCLVGLSLFFAGVVWLQGTIENEAARIIAVVLFRVGGAMGMVGGLAWGFGACSPFPDPYGGPGEGKG